MGLVFSCVAMGVLTACTPEKTGSKDPVSTSSDYRSVVPTSPIVVSPAFPGFSRASLWTDEQTSLLGDRRALQPGDILTVVIEIDDSAEFSNSTNTGRVATEGLAIPQLFGIPQRVQSEFPPGAGLDTAIDFESSSEFSGDGRIRRNEQLTLRVAASVYEVLDNGVMRIFGRQKIRVNHETRDLVVEGYVRPQDISRRNEISYDKIAAAQIFYGGDGSVSAVQKPRWGQRFLNKIIPF
ncbi:MAG: flagellar basal body L-ring protein FlgH [Pseudomonadota bacterium]